MAGWLLDTNHLSAALKPRSPLRDRIEQACHSGERVGTCVPVLCEWEAGIQALEREESYRRALHQLLKRVRVWPIEVQVARLYREVYQDLRSRGRVLSQVDMMLAALANAMGLTILSADQDFLAVPGLRLESWLS